MQQFILADPNEFQADLQKKLDKMKHDKGITSLSPFQSIYFKKPIADLVFLFER